MVAERKTQENAAGLEDSPCATWDCGAKGQCTASRGAILYGGEGSYIESELKVGWEAV
jgi:hypothetical protein